LVEKGADINTADKYGLNALIAAAMRGHFEIVQFLVEEGADINAADKYGMNALMAAVESGHLETVRFLVKNGADVSAQNDWGRTALTLALKEKRYRIAEILCTGISKQRYIVPYTCRK
jgi:ankyrin repeat protein